jgi:hypothetical protein
MTRFCCEHCRISALNITARDEMLKCLFISWCVDGWFRTPSVGGGVVLRVDIAVSPFIGYRYSTSSCHRTANLLSHHFSQRRKNITRITGYLSRHPACTMRFLKSTVFWDVMPCSLVGLHRRFWQKFCLHLQNWSVRQSNTQPAWSACCLFLACCCSCLSVILWISRQ